MRGTFALFVFTLIVIATGLAVYSALGIIRNSDDPAAGVAVSQFGSAIRQHDGKAACSLLSQSTQSKLEDDRKKPCEQAILEVAGQVQPGDSVTSVNVAETSAFVKTARGPTFFLDRDGKTWKLSGVGCTKQAGDAPYSCALQS
jgi:type II secretory pathway pseudopilin PulG